MSKSGRNNRYGSHSLEDDEEDNINVRDDVKLEESCSQLPQVAKTTTNQTATSKYHHAALSQSMYSHQYKAMLASRTVNHRRQAGELDMQKFGSTT